MLSIPIVSNLKLTTFNSSFTTPRALRYSNRMMLILITNIDNVHTSKFLVSLVENPSILIRRLIEGGQATEL